MVYSDAHRQELEQLLAVSIGPACHELRSPLAVVYGFSRMLEVSEQADPAHIQHILQGSSRLDELLDQLATMGRIAACRTVPRQGSSLLRRECPPQGRQDQGRLINGASGGGEIAARGGVGS